MKDQQIIELLKWTGHLQYPFGKEQDLSVPAGLDALSFALTDPAIERAIASYQDFNVVSVEPLALKHHSRSVCCDGKPGPATHELFDQPRCGCPDYGPQVQPAIGTGSWKGCHDIGDFHSAAIYVHEEGMPSFLKPHFDKAWDLVVAAYDKIGLRWIRTDNKRAANIDFLFVNRAPWLGLAIVGQRQSCVSQIWCKFNASWRPANIVNEWGGLMAHEWGHNGGLYHTRGGLMNAYLITGLPVSWDGDPSESILKRFFGGEPIPPVEPPTPPEPPAPPVPPMPPGGELYGIQELYTTDEKGKVVSLGEFDVTRRAKAP